MITDTSSGFNGSEKPDDFLIAGIGASAGGIEALSSFFQHVPAASGIAYVVILHLSPDHDSQLAEVLQAVATIPVSRVTEKTLIVPDHVYVVSPDHHLVIEDGHISPSVNITQEDRRAPVDLFFRNLADVYGPRAVCIVLSGTGANGSMGLKRVKERGGIAYVQNPQEAEFHEMPRNSIATNLVDDVLPVAEIPEHLINYRNRTNMQDIMPEPDQRPELQQQALREIFTRLRQRTGHDFSNYKRPTLLRRIERRINIRNLPDLPAYSAYMQEHPDEVTALLKNLLISVTNFFRDRKAFEALEKDVIPAIFAGKTGEDQVRIWVGGCATGEEAYSVAMLCCEHIHEIPDAPKIQIFATDIDEAAIASAREGFYTLNDAADVSPERLRRFFTKDGDGYRVRRELRELILFAHHNFLKDPPFSKLDLVACRNVLIYLNAVAQERVTETFHFALKPKKFLFLGTSESVDAASDLYTLYSRENHIFQSREVAPRNYPIPESVPRFHFAKTHPLQKPEDREGGRRISFGELHQQMLEQYAPPSVVVNEEYEIVHMTERANRYFELTAGEPTQNLLKLIRQEMRLELRSALYRAVQNNTVAELRNLRFTINGHTESVDIHVRPVLENEETPKGYILIVFIAGDEFSQNGEKIISASDEPMAKQLEEELINLKKQLRSSVEHHEYQAEELKASNEELQAMNEELRSAAEELETSKEELQSINEELRTVNQELKVKIEETGIVSNNLQNLINSVDVGTIFLDRSFCIRLFTPAILNIFNLKAADYGRPITDITNRLHYDSLLQDAETVLEKLTVIEREVSTSDEHFFTMRLLPYRTSEDRINGVVVTFFDITARKKSDEVLRASEEKYLSELENKVEQRTKELKGSRDLLLSIYDTSLYGMSVLHAVRNAAGEIEDFRIVIVNKELEKETHRTDLVGKIYSVEYPGIRDAGIYDLMLRVMETGEPGEMEYYYSHEGFNKWFACQFVKLDDGLVATNIDISERRSAEIKMTEEHRRLREAQSIGSIGSFEWNVGEQTVVWSDEMFRITGTASQSNDVPVTFSNELIHPDDREYVFKIKARSLISSGQYEIKHRILLHDGTVKFVSQRFESIGDEQGNVIRVHGTVQDITKAIASDNMMQEQAHFIQSTNDAMPDILFVLDLHDCTILYINHSFEERVGLPATNKEETGRNFFMIIYEEDAPAMKQHLKEMMNAEDGEVREIEYRIRAADGELRWFRDRNAVFRRDKDGMPYEKIGIAQDITDRKKAEQELKENILHLQYANDNLQQFASIASHDLQEPLRKLQFFTSVLKKFTGVLPDEGKETIEKIRLTSERMSMLIREVLEFSKIAYGKKHFSKANLQKILLGVIDDLSLLIDESSATIVIQKNLPVINAVPLQMSQLFYNLISNALKFRQAGVMPVISISVRSLSEKETKQNHFLRDDLSYIEIVIADNGIGFNEEYRDQIFQIFERLHSVEEYEGTGVGLALCKKIAENHSGHIYAVSEEGKGAAFHILLSLKQQL